MPTEVVLTTQRLRTWPQGRLARWSLLVALAGALTTPAWWLWPASPAASLVVVQVVSEHIRMLMSSRPPDARGSAADVARWFHGKVDFAVKVPTIDAEFLGGGASYLFDRYSACLFYRKEGHLVSTHIFVNHNFTLPRGAGVTLGPVSGTVLEHQGFRVAAWRAGDLLHLLVSALPRDQLVDLARQMASGARGAAKESVRRREDRS